MTLGVFTFLALALVGHAALWTAVNNRLHATALPYRLVSLVEKLIGLFVVAVPLGFTYWLWWRLDVAPNPRLRTFNDLGFWLLYFVPTQCIALLFIPAWARRQFVPKPIPAFVSNHTRQVNVARTLGYKPVGTLRGRVAASLPGNEILRLGVQEKTLALPNWPVALDGLTIVHISDLHFTGDLTVEYFQTVVAEANAFEADLVTITGDVIDSPACLPWIAASLGRLRARSGVFAILGNHDKRKVRPDEVRSALTDCGIQYVGGTWRTLEVRGTPLLLAGNELPWLGSAPNLSEAPPPLNAGGVPRVLLSHSPDQIRWAERHEFDLMLAGHTHGGQIRFPVLGPMVAPSYYGVRYASGVFHEGRTLLHVSRGLSGKEPLRWNCPPELTKLVLRRA